jgi:trimethylamine---corrinoid protein Co-methyltransferase
MTVSYEQLVLDHEMLEIGYRLLEGFAVNPETLALEVIARAAPRGDFLTDEHTLRHLRSGEHYQPTLSSRYSHDQWLEAGGKDVVARAQDKAQHILQTHHPLPLAAPVQRELNAILAAAGR